MHFKYIINLIAREKTCNSIARSFRSKPSLLSYLVFFLRMGDQLKNKNKPGERHPAKFSQ